MSKSDESTGDDPNVSPVELYPLAEICLIPSSDIFPLTSLLDAGRRIAQRLFDGPILYGNQTEEKRRCSSRRGKAKASGVVLGSVLLYGSLTEGLSSKSNLAIFALSRSTQLILKTLLSNPSYTLTDPYQCFREIPSKISSDGSDFQDEGMQGQERVTVYSITTVFV
ncbi:hypothetical protein K435DRAFT_938453 [Dendrothele bispora CBS 962.96]|uniref:Uncharacterized protein n=1 Tax=Dendrothele bispora (strain CBS 962.96) TaxID=1314807 RepID=A0A4S8MBH0_DENBC|nr:hypothetical protein K435DRAFT_938453 [Dendrothele bispora CBS 962.96]